MSVDLGTEVTMIYRGRFLALYKGIVPKIMRLGPGGAIMLLVYEYMHDYLTKRFLFIETTSIAFTYFFAKCLYCHF